MTYKITRMKKDKSEFRMLSQNKKRWLVINSKHRPCIMTNDEADEFIQAKGNDLIYYFFKTQAV
jgi:hypothetical protein